ncbi:hypothetical protein TYRP_014721 [Tyrophagus putrescentiae]|nr:hypothetical protein TYRP_014721 [Tyrophagus putrescentiae]
MRKGVNHQKNAGKQDDQAENLRHFQSKQSTSRRPPHLPPTVSTPMVTVFDVDHEKYRSPRAVDLDWKTHPKDLALALVFELLPFSHQLQLRLVSRRWCRTVETLCRSRRSVKFFGWAPTRADNDELFFSHRTAAAILEPAKGAALFTRRLLPNIVSLGAVCTEKWQAVLLLTFLNLPKNSWGQQLERLHIRGLPKNKALESKLLTLIFRGLPNLKALSLYGLSAHLVQVQLPTKLPVLSQLETFMLEGYSGDLTPILMQLGPSIIYLLVHAEHDEVNLKVKVLETFLKANPKVGDQLHLLDLALIPDHPLSLWQLICNHFPTLKTLEVSFLFGVTLSETLPYLHLLPQLEKLNFNVDLKKVSPFSVLSTLHPLPQVKTLFLGAIAGPSFDVTHFRDTFGRLFPNIEELRLATFSPNAVKAFNGEVKRIFPRLKRHQIGLANRGKMEVGVERKVYRKGESFGKPGHWQGGLNCDQR